MPNLQVKTVSSSLTNKLVSLPESGMGYQYVQVNHRDRSVHRGVVFNAEQVMYADELNDEREFFGIAKSMLSESRGNLAKFASFSSDIVDVNVVRRGLVFKSRLQSLADQLLAESLSAAESDIEFTSAGDLFRRFCAFKNDRRLREDGSYSPGTYATTRQDSAHVHTGIDAVERYALPDPAPAIYRFSISPLANTAIRKGIVQAANGHRGEGIEVIFNNGTSRNTVALPPDQIPPI